MAKRTGEFTAMEGGKGEYGDIGGEGPQTDKHLPQSPFTGQFF
jgi:hypothetical protein